MPRRGSKLEGRGFMGKSYGIPGSYGVLPAFSPTDIDGCVLSLRSDLGVTQVGGLVSAWVDQSETGHNASVAGTPRPVYTGNELNGYPAIVFDGVVDYMDLVPLDAMTSYTIFAVFKFANQGDMYSIIDQNSMGYALWFNGQTGYVSDGSNVVVIANVPGSLWSYSLIVSKRSITVGTMYQNGNLINTGNNALMTNSIALDMIGYSSLLETYSPISIVELIIYNSALSDANRVLVENYLNGKYEIF